MKCNLRDLFWFVALCAALIAWAVDRERIRSENKRLSTQIEQNNKFSQEFKSLGIDLQELKKSLTEIKKRRANGAPLGAGATKNP